MKFHRGYGTTVGCLGGGWVGGEEGVEGGSRNIGTSECLGNMEVAFVGSIGLLWMQSAWSPWSVYRGIFSHLLGLHTLATRTMYVQSRDTLM